MGVFGKIKAVLNDITIEPIFFLYSLCLGFYIIVSKNLYVDKVCKVNLNFTEEICDNIQQHEEEQNKVQQYVSSLQAYNSVIQAVPACIFALFAGPWSDRHGRKLLIVCAVFGYILCNVVFIINIVYFYELKAEYLLFECIQGKHSICIFDTVYHQNLTKYLCFLDMTGGSTVFYLACYSYISDISSKESRTRRIAFLDGVFPLGFYIGNAASGPVKKYLGFMYNFSFSMLAAVLAVAYCVIFVKDSRIQRDKRVRRELLEEIEHLQEIGSKEGEEL